MAILASQHQGSTIGQPKALADIEAELKGLRGELGAKRAALENADTKDTKAIGVLLTSIAELEDHILLVRLGELHARLADLRARKAAREPLQALADEEARIWDSLRSLHNEGARVRLRQQVRDE